jgi:hypothetical protein
VLDRLLTREVGSRDERQVPADIQGGNAVSVEAPSRASDTLAVRS